MKRVTITGTALILIGIMIFMIRLLTPSYLDKESVVHEWFFLVPSGYLFLIVGVMLYLISLVMRLFKQ
jgi:preprotein translocase subunit Sss1